VNRFLGIDLGTTFLKGAVLDLEHCRLQHVRRLPCPEPVAHLPPTRCEIEPAAMLAAMRRLLAGLLAEAPDAAGLVLSSQMHCLVLTDDRGRALSNIITWRDQRGLEPHPSGSGNHFDVLRKMVPPEVAQDVGRELRVGVPVTTLFWLKEQNLLSGNAHVASLPDFVLANLLGRPPATEATQAAAHGLLDLGRSEWHQGLIDMLGLGMLRWPRIQHFGEAVGTMELAGRHVPCFTPVGDQQCALAGAALAEGELSLNISTGSQVSLLCRDRRAGEFQVRPYFDGRWLHTIVQVPAGRALDLLVKLLTEISQGTPGPDPWSYIEQALERVPTTDLEVNLAFYAGAVGDRGAIRNIREDNFTVGHLFAAAFANMAANYALCAGRLAPTGDWRRVVFSGGVAQHFPRLRKEILGRLGGCGDHRLCSSTEDTLQGLLVLALVCARRVKTVAEAGRLVEEAQRA
jgi:sugar (pentulose or hexulose) kinase